MQSTIEDWLAETVSVAEAEAAFTPTANQSKENPRLPDQPFGFEYDKWQALKSQMSLGDEIRYFCSPPQTWRDLHGRAGIAVVRAGRVVDCMVLRMN